MTFKDVAVRNFKAQAGRYFSYFLCSSFSVMIFFMYATLLFNRELNSREDISLIFKVGLASVALFSIFFINYAHSAFIRSRNAEFALYMTLGMDSRDIRKLVLLENTAIITASLFAGLISGLVASRLFQMVVIKLLNIDGIGYVLDIRSFAATSAVFITIFLSVMAISAHSTGKLDISDILKSVRKGDHIKKTGTLYCITTVIILLSSFVYLYILTHNNSLKSSGIAVTAFFLLSFLGVRMATDCLGNVFLGFLNRNPGLYYKNILAVTEIIHKFNRQKKIIFVLSVLSSMIVFMVASAFSLLSLTGSITEQTQPHHLEYAELGDINKISPTDLSSILSSADSPLVGQNTVEFISLTLSGNTDKYDLLRAKPVVSQTVFNRSGNIRLDLPRGQAANIITAWEPGYHGIEPSKKITVEAGGRTVQFVIKDSLHTLWVAGASVYPSSSGIVLNDEDYAELKAAVQPQNIGLYHMFEFRDWRKTGGVMEKLTEQLSRNNSAIPGTEKSVSGFFKPKTRLDAYNGLLQGYSLFIFVTTVMGILFFIAAGSVLYFKQFTEIGAAKARFVKVFKLGVTEKEVSSMISKELAAVFFTPLVLGSILGYSFIYFMTYWVSGQFVIGEFMRNASVVVAAYFIFQAAFYIASKNKYTSEVIDYLHT